MKILFYNHAGEVSGAERVLLMILAHLDRDGFEPVVVCPTESQMIKKVDDLEIKTHPVKQLQARFTWRPHRLLRYLLSFCSVIRRAREIVASEAPDIIHANSVRAGLVMSVAAIRLKTRVIWHVHDVLPRHPLTVAVRWFAWFTGSRVLAVSEAAAERFRGILFRLFPRRLSIAVIHNAVESGRFRPNALLRQATRRALGFGDNDFLVGMVGHLTPNKGQAELIDAFATIAAELSEASLILVGDTLFNRDEGYAEKIRTTIDAHDLVDRVRLLGTREDVRELMQAFDLLVLNSRSEAFPLTALEGLASGRTVLATAVGGTPEMILHRETGWLINAGRQDELVSAIKTLFRDPELREQLGRNGRATAFDKFSIRQFTKNIHTYYQTIAAERALPRYAEAKTFQPELTAD